QCLSDAQRLTIQLESQRIRDSLGFTPTLGASFPTIEDPFGPGVSNTTGRPIVFYFDHDAGAGVQDYECSGLTYDGHQGNDFAITDFYEMDEGVPVLAVAGGVVTFKREIYYDRIWQADTALIEESNIVIISHFDGSEALYVHFRTQKVSVEIGDTVQTGDTLGLVGSSGYTLFPHVHVELTQSGVKRDPFSGACNGQSSLWNVQPPFAGGLPAEVLTHGVTTIPPNDGLVMERPPSQKHITAGSGLWTWNLISHIKVGDSLHWDVYHNGSFWTNRGWRHGDQWSAGHRKFWAGYTLGPSPGADGTYRVEFFLNSVKQYEDTFMVNSSANTTPTADDAFYNALNTEYYDNVFTGSDADGSIFWYEPVSGPSHGTFFTDGGRRRKFSYKALSGFVGEDTVFFTVIDDDSAYGDTGMIVFDVGQGCVDPDSDGFGNPGYPGSPCPDDNCPSVYNPTQDDA
ncbi:MAG TPA: M23 family metallopeptidase, partial [candidate division Zixibacteria bacterium]|nr:M23 family metallopeptidase [candidate division Zixibacteria bacterium]